ncbi:hypothetical protein [Nibribacter koreensis]
MPNQNKPVNDQNGNKSVLKTDQGKQTERDRDSQSDNDTYKRSVTGYDSTKQDENFDNTSRFSSENSLDERDTNDGDANQENNF